MMCRGDPSYQGLKGPDSTPYAPSGLGLNQAAALAEYHQRLQLLDYSRLRLHPFLPYAFPADAAAASAGPYGFPSPFVRFDPRRCLTVEEPKPQHSYIGLIAMAILSIPDKKMVLSDIYQYILDQYPYFRNRGPGWRNSIRHNLSLNDCFVKAGRSANGKGHYWAIHPANVEDFKKGDFRRRKAQRKVRKHMGLAVPDDDDSPAPSPPLHQPRRRFDMESLLAPDSPKRPLPATAPPPQWGHPVGFVGQYAPSCWGAYPPGGQMSPQQAPQVSTIPTIQRWQQELRSASDPEPGKIDD